MWCETNKECLKNPPLRYNSDGYPVPFWTNVTYECQPGYFFKHDKQQKSFAVTCRDNGYFFEPSPWPMCIRGKCHASLSELIGSLKLGNVSCFS